MSQRITASVGEGGKNLPADVFTIRKLLDKAGMQPGIVQKVERTFNRLACQWEVDEDLADWGLKFRVLTMPS